MRILMVVRPAEGGMREHVALLGRGLDARGNEADVAAPPGSGPLLDAVAEGRIGRPVEISGSPDPLAVRSAARELAAVLAEDRYDVVHAHGAMAGLAASAAAARQGVPCVVTAHNHVLRRSDVGSLRGRAYRALMRSAARRVTRFVAVSASIRDELVTDLGLAPDAVSVVRNGIDLATYFESRERSVARSWLGVEGDGPIVGAASRFAPQKGLESLIDAMPPILAAYPETTFVLAGDGPGEPDLRVRCISRGVGDAVRWPGRVADMPVFYAACDVFVSPSLAEGFGLALAEAQACGVPIVSTRVGGSVEVVAEGETALVVEPGDAAGIASSVVRLLSDDVLSARLGQAGRARAAREFDPERMVDETLGVYEEIVATSGDRP